MLVDRDDLAIANARLMTGTITINQLAAPPIGAFLFTLGQFVPFATQAIVVLLAVLMIARLRLPPHGRASDGADAGLARHRRGRPLDLAPRRGPHPGADHPDLQRHLRRGLVGAGPLRHRAPRPRQHRLRPDHDGRRPRRPARDGDLRMADPADQPRQPDADRAGHRDLHPPRAGLDLEPVRRAAGLLRLRCARVRVGDHLDHDPPAGRARPRSRAGSARSTWSVSSAAWWWAPRSAACSPSAGASRRRSGSRSSARRSSWC